MLAMAVYNPESEGRSVNKVVLIDPSGKVRFQYLKHKLVPVIEKPDFVPGDGKVPHINTPYGTIAPAICNDANFPGFIHKTAKEKADIFLVPALDWKEITPILFKIPVFRAIENGFSMIRSTGAGLSVAVNHLGQPLAVKNYFTTDESMMISHVPVNGVTTIYSKIGDLFAWLCIAGFLILVGWGFFRNSDNDSIR